MPNEIKVVFCKETQSYAAECSDCGACGPRETNPQDAAAAWKRREHDVEWRYRKGLKIARRFGDAIGQRDKTKIEALAIEIGTELED